MYIPADELKRSARLASAVSESALQLLDIADRLQDREAAQALVEVARRLVGVSSDMNRTVENTAVANTAGLGGLFDLARLVRLQSTKSETDPDRSPSVAR
jgi:hypothetical protein